MSDLDDREVLHSESQSMKTLSLMKQSQGVPV